MTFIRLPASRRLPEAALAVASALSLSLLSTRAPAQQAEGYAVNRYEPSERGSDWFSAESLDFRGQVRPALGLVGDYSHRSLVIYNPDGTVRAPVLDHNFIIHAGAAVVFVERLRLGLSLPIQAYGDGRGGRLSGIFYPAPASSSGIGDLRISGDVRLLGEW